MLRFAEEGKVELCIAYAMLLELEEVLSYEKFYQRLEKLGQTPSQLASYALDISSPFDVSRSGILPIVSADPDDDIFLLCAAAAQAKYVVTNDPHLLNMESYQEIPIIKIEKFLDAEFNI